VHAKLWQTEKQIKNLATTLKTILLLIVAINLLDMALGKHPWAYGCWLVKKQQWGKYLFLFISFHAMTC